MNVEERCKKAVELKHGSNNCAQAAALSCSDLVEMEPDLLWKLNAGFGGGMGTMEGTCGALCGAVLIAGLLTQGERILTCRNIDMKITAEIRQSTDSAI